MTRPCSFSCFSEDHLLFYLFCEQFSSTTVHRPTHAAKQKPCSGLGEVDLTRPTDRVEADFEEADLVEAYLVEAHLVETLSEEEKGQHGKSLKRLCRRQIPPLARWSDQSFLRTLRSQHASTMRTRSPTASWSPRSTGWRLASRRSLCLVRWWTCAARRLMYSFGRLKR